MDMRRPNNKGFTGEELCNKLVEAQAEQGMNAPKYANRAQQEKQAWDKIAEYVERDCVQRFADGMMSERRATERKAAEEAAKRGTEQGDGSS